MTVPIERIADAVGAAGFAFEPSPDAPAGEHHWMLDHLTGDLARPLLLIVHEAAATVVCYSVEVDDVPPEQRVAVMELLTRANFGLLEGTFELDLSDGEVRCRTSTRLGADADVDHLVAHVIRANLAVFDVYGDAIAAVAAGAVDPSSAIEEVEGG